MIQKTYGFSGLNNSKGFTLAELAIVLAIIATIIALSLEPSVRVVRWQKESETKEKLFKMSKAIESVYKNNAWFVDNSNTNTFVFYINGNRYTLVNAPADNNVNLPALMAIASVSDIVSNNVQYDSMHNVLQIYVSNRLTDTSSNIRYHVLAVVSPGWNNILDSNFNMSTGVLTLSGDDLGVVVSGFQIQQDKINETNKKLFSVKNAYQAYFTSLYLSDPTRSIYVNRFAMRNSSCNSSQWWDSNSRVDNSACVVNTASNIGLKSALGLSQDAVTTAWGREIIVDNSSSLTRNPDNVGNTPPYTARLLAELPWGGNIDITVTGQY